MELELPTVQSQHVGAENQTQSFARTASALTSEPSLHLLMNSTDEFLLVGNLGPFVKTVGKKQRISYVQLTVKLSLCKTEDF